MGARRKVYAAVLTLVVGAAAWVFLAPPQLGGSTSYVITTGNSMEPLLHEGDLAIIRSQDSYGVSDVVAYHSVELDRTVLHRIVAERDGRFVFKGDNNDFLDPEKPAQARFTGTMLFHIPNLGTGLRALRSPVGVVVATLAIMALVASGGVKSSRRRRRRAKHSHIEKPRTGDPRPVIVPHQEQVGSVARVIPIRRAEGPPPEMLEPEATTAPVVRRGAKRARAVVIVAMVGVVGFGSAGLYLRAEPLTAVGRADIGYAHSGVFSYNADVPDSPAYDGPTLVVGEPIFLNVLDEIALTHTYRLDSEARGAVDADGRLVARLTAANGLRRTITLPTTQTPTSDGVKLSSRLRLARIVDVVRRVERATGVDQSSYGVRVMAEIDVRATLDGHWLEDRFEADMELGFDGLQLSPPVAGEEGATTFETSQSGTLSAESPSIDDVSVGGRTVPSGTLQNAAVFGAGTSVAVLMIALAFLILVGPGDDAQRIQAKYGKLLVSVNEGPHAIDAIDVSDFETLARLAEQFEQVILHEAARGGHVYTVTCDGLIYRYRVMPPDKEEPVVEPSRKITRSVRQDGISRYTLVARPPRDGARGKSASA
ncbi:MAG: hypothetical protein ACRDKT_06585 [Actinomycetota bacterium]